MEPRLRLRRFRLERGSNSRPLDYPTELPGLLYQGEVRQRKERYELHLSYAVPKVQWVSITHTLLLNRESVPLYGL